MKTLISTLTLTVLATPSFASSGPFFSLNNTNFVVTIAFLLFIALLIYLKVPGKLTGMLDQRAVDIKSDLDEARALRDEARAVLASYERKQKEVQEQADKIVKNAKTEAKTAAVQAKADLKASIARRIQAAQDQIKSAEAAAIKEVRDTAISVATVVASDVIASTMSTKDAGGLIDAAIKDVGEKLH